MVFTPTSGELHYYPDPNFVGDDTWQFHLNDGTVDTAPMWVHVNVQEVPDPPVARPDAWVGKEDVSLFIPYAALLANDYDVDTPLADLRVQPDLSNPPPHGSTVAAQEDGLWIGPPPDFSGDETVYYLVLDGAVQSQPAPITVTFLGVNDAPIVQEVTVDPVTGPVTQVAAATDPEGDPWTIVLPLTALPGELGDVTISADRTSWTFTPRPGGVGTTSFAFQVEDSHQARSLPAVVRLVVNAPDTATTDTGDPTGTGCVPVAWYADGDGDGFGAPGFSLTACQAPGDRMVDNADDCDDARPDVHAGAREIGGDGIDQDCDGIDNQAIPVAACQTGPGGGGSAGWGLGLLALALRRRGGGR
jgi:hypothetical protein